VPDSLENLSGLIAWRGIHDGAFQRVHIQIFMTQVAGDAGSLGISNEKILTDIQLWSIRAHLSKSSEHRDAAYYICDLRADKYPKPGGNKWFI
jgi:hypothetical protein